MTTDTTARTPRPARAPKAPATAPVPPPAALAQDAHWAATRERLAARTRPTKNLAICDDTAAKQALAEAEYVQRRLKVAADDQPDTPDNRRALQEAADAVAAAQEAVDAASIFLHFRAMPRKDFEALKDEHPANDEQMKRGLEYDVENLGPLLLEASSQDGMTAEDASYYLDTWGAGEAAQLFQAAWDVQLETRIDLGKG